MADRPFGKGQGVDRNHYRAPRATSPTAEARVSEALKSEFESPVAYQFARVAQRQRPLAQNKFRCGFESRPGYHAPCARWEGSGPTHRHDPARSRDGVPITRL